MGLLDPPQKPYIVGAPLITNPTVIDSTTSIVGISRDRKTLYGAPNQAANVGQLYTSTDDGITWSSGWFSSNLSAQIISVVETDIGELLISTGPTTGFIRRTNNWLDRTTPGSLSSSVLAVSSAASGVMFRHDWGLQTWGTISLVCEYGSNAAATPANNARYVSMSNDGGVTWVQIFDLFSSVAGVRGAGLTAQSKYHTHGAAYDPWSGRIFVTHGDDNSGIWYSDDAAQLAMVNDAAITSGSPTLTVAALATSGAAKTTFSALDVGKPIYGSGIPMGATILSVESRSSLTMSANASATASGVSVGWGPLTWKKLQYARNNAFQSVGILPTRNGVFFGTDGVPGGINRIRRAEPNIGVIETLFRLGTPTSSTPYLQNAQYQGRDDPSLPALFGLTAAISGRGGALLMVHPDGERAWNIWDDPYQQTFSSFTHVFGPTFSGNIVGTLQSARTSSGYQIFRTPMPKVPT